MKEKKICYLILPEGVKKDLTVELEKLTERYGVSTVVIEEVNWNDGPDP
jgi:hypothetical protein